MYYSNHKQNESYSLLGSSSLISLASKAWFSSDPSDDLCHALRFHSFRPEPLRYAPVDSQTAFCPCFRSSSLSSVDERRHLVLGAAVHTSGTERETALTYHRSLCRWLKQPHDVMAVCRIWHGQIGGSCEGFFIFFSVKQTSSMTAGHLSDGRVSLSVFWAPLASWDRSARFSSLISIVCAFSYF